MSYLIDQSTTSSPLMFLLISSSDHISGLTGASPTVTISKNGAAFASPAGSVTELANGWYKVAANSTDNNTLGPLALHASAASADPTDVIFRVVAFNPDVALATSSSLSTLQTTASGISSTVGTLATSSGLGTLQTTANTIVNKTNLIATNSADSPNAITAQGTIGTGVQINMTQAVPTSNTAQTIGDALNAARAQGFGKWVLSGTNLTLYAGDGTTTVRIFSLDSATAPTQRS